MELFSETTLYYYFSTIAQVVAATVALVSIAIQFRIINLRRHLVGDGQAVYNRAIAGQRGYDVLDDKLKQRLSDALEREDLDGIGDVIRFLVEANAPSYIDLILNPHGFNQLNTTFFKAINAMKVMKLKIVSIVLISIITISTALISLVFIDLYKVFPAIIVFISVGLSFILFIATMIMNYKGIKKGLE